MTLLTRAILALPIVGHTAYISGERGWIPSLFGL